MNFLGHLVSGDVVRTDPEKTSAVLRDGDPTVCVKLEAVPRYGEPTREVLFADL